MLDSMNKSPARAGRGSWRRRVSLLLLLGGVAAAGCRPQAAENGSDLKAEVEFDPSPPAVGPTDLEIVLKDAAGKPVRMGRLEVEGNMNHAGMTPVFTQLEETEPGQYAGTIEFTMGGDWFLLLSGELPDGRRFEKKVDVPGVKSK